MSRSIQRPTLILAALVAALLAACDRAPDAAEKPADEGTAAPPPDTLIRIGDEATNTLRVWVEVLATVETEESASSASKRLAAIAGQFDALAERAAQLPKISAAEFKRIDERMDSQMLRASDGLELQRARIFALPAAIKDKVLPAHRRAYERLRAMSRSILETRERNPSAGDADGTEEKAPGA